MLITSDFVTCIVTWTRLPGRPRRPVTATKKAVLAKALTLDCCRLREVFPFVHRLRYREEDIEALFVNDTLVHLTRIPVGVAGQDLGEDVDDEHEGTVGTARATREIERREPVHAYFSDETGARAGRGRMDEATVAAGMAAVRSLAEAKAKALVKSRGNSTRN